MKKLLLVICLLSPAVSLFAQQAQTGVEGFSLTAPLQIQAGTDHNFLVDQKNPPAPPPGEAPDLRPNQVDDKVMTITLPQINFQNSSRRHDFTFTWLPEFEIFQHTSSENSMNQRATGEFSYFLTRRVALSIGDNFQSSRDPSRILNNVFLLLPRANYRENDFNGAIEFLPNQITALEVRYDNSYAIFGQTGPFQARLLDSFAQGISISIARMLKPNQRIRAVYSHFRIQPVSGTASGSDVPATNVLIARQEHSANLEYRWSPNPSTFIGLMGGIVKLDSGLNYNFRGSIDRRMGPFWAGGGFARALWFDNPVIGSPGSPGFVQQGGGTGFYDMATMRFKGQTSQDTAITLGVTMSRTVASQVFASNKSLFGGARFDYRVTDRSVLFASFTTFQQTQNAFTLSPLARNRFMVGVEISLSSETSRRKNHSNKDAQYVALTDHRRRRPPQQ